MNFFFGINNDYFKSEIQIPMFQNRNFKKQNLKLFKTYPKENKWILKEIVDKKIDDYFYILKNQDISNDEIYFLTHNDVFDTFDEDKLGNFDNFTDTFPEFRANLKLYLNEGGFSSYQSEYPYGMVKKKGLILSSISSLANLEADENYVLIRNIYEKPIQNNFDVCLVNIITKSIEEKFEIKTNYTNCIKLKNEHIKPEIFLVTDRYLGIPMYVSVKNNFLSFEHTHPPHEYILSKNKFLKVSDLKKEIYEIIS